MIEEIREYIKTILAFVLFLRVISLLFPNHSYEKYVRPVGMLLLAVLTIRPLLGDSFDKNRALENMKQEFFTPNETNQIMSDFGENIYKSAVLSEYKEQLANRLEVYLHDMGYGVRRVQFVLAEDPENFGTIVRLDAVIFPEGKEKNTKIEQIRVLLSEEKMREKREKTAEELMVLERISGYFCLEKEQVDVTIGEE